MGLILLCEATGHTGEGNNLWSQCLTAAKEGRELPVASDQFGSPDKCKRFIRLILHLIKTNEYGT